MTTSSFPSLSYLVGTREIFQQLRVHTVLAEDQSAVPYNRAGWLIVNPALEEDTLFWTLFCTHMCTPLPHIYIIKNKNKILK